MLSIEKSGNILDICFLRCYDTTSRRDKGASSSEIIPYADYFQFLAPLYNR